MRAQIVEKQKLIIRYQGDLKNLLPKETNKTGVRLQELMAGAEKVRGYLRGLMSPADNQPGKCLWPKTSRKLTGSVILFFGKIAAQVDQTRISARDVENSGSLVFAVLLI